MTAPSVTLTTLSVKMTLSVSVQNMKTRLDSQAIVVFALVVPDLEEGTIIVMGGLGPGSQLDNVEVVSLDGSLKCGFQADLPFPNEELVAVVNSEGQPMACGGQLATDRTSCLVYDAGAGVWREGPNMLNPRSFGPDLVRLSDGRYWITGDSTAPGWEQTNQTNNFTNITGSMCTLACYKL